MKKTILTLLVAFVVLFTSNAQKLVNFDDIDGTLGGWCSAAAVADNPVNNGLNTSAKTSMFTNIPANWQAAQIDFPEVTIGEYNAVEFLVYVDDAGDGIDLKEIKFGAFNGIIDPELATITESGKWVKMVYQLDGATSTDVINKFFTKINSAETAEIHVYFDEFALTNYTFVPDQQPARVTATAVKVTGEMLIDGKDLEVDYANANWNAIDQGVINAPGIAGKYKLLWDTAYLYMMVSITDPDIVLWDDEGYASWKGDGLQIYLDAKNRRHINIVYGASGTAANPDRESEAAIAANKGFSQESDFNIFGDYKAEFKQGSLITETGYQLELAWYWKGIATSVMDAAFVEDWVVENIKENYKFSFDLQLNDARGADRVSVLSWCAVEGPYGNSGVWGEVNLGLTSSIASNASVSNQVFPNPANNEIILNMANVATVEIFNILGAKVMDATMNDNKVNVSSLNSGVYVLKATDINGKVAVTKFNKK